MAVGASFDISQKELNKLLKKMKKFPRKLQRQTVTKALKRAAVSIRDDARSKVPKDTGELAKTIKVQMIPKKYRGSNREGYYVGLDRNVELDGKGKRTVHEKKGKGKRQAGSLNTSAYPVVYGRFVEMGTVKMPARPFMMPALDGAMPRVLNMVRYDTASGIKKALT